MVRPVTAPDYTMSTRANDPRYDARWKMPGYTGHINALYETFSSTPVPSQAKAEYGNSSEMDPLSRPAVREPNRDPCNDPNTWFKPVPELAWPPIAAQHARRQNMNNKSSIVFGDRRICQENTHYKDTMKPPGTVRAQWHGVATESKPKLDIACMSMEERTELYDLMKSKLSEVQLGHIIDNLKLRFAGKLNTSYNTNGFKLLKLFQKYDVKGTGKVQMEEFVGALASFGIQLPEDATVVLFSTFDLDGTGYLDYTRFISTLIEPEYLKLGFSTYL